MYNLLIGYSNRYSTIYVNSPTAPLSNFDILCCIVYNSNHLAKEERYTMADRKWEKHVITQPKPGFVPNFFGKPAEHVRATRMGFMDDEVVKGGFYTETVWFTKGYEEIAVHPTTTITTRCWASTAAIRTTPKTSAARWRNG